MVGVQDQKDMPRFMYLLAPRVYSAVKRVHQLLVGGAESEGEGWAKSRGLESAIADASSDPLLHLGISLRDFSRFRFIFN